MPPPPIPPRLGAPPPPIPPRPSSPSAESSDDRQRPYHPVYLPFTLTSWLIPNFELRVEDVSHPGAQLFFEHVRPAEALKDAVISTCSWLYTLRDVPTNVQNVLLVLRPMPGVAYTTGSRTHKEIHFSVNHIQKSAARAREEILGVLTHEMVHCFQYNARGTCPGGLIEGIADWVRLNSGLAPPHWKRGKGDKWDAGYDATAFFLAWIEEQRGKGTIYQLNAAMNDRTYHENIFQDLTGLDVYELWRLYKLDCPSDTS
ncbi:peptidase of plants and bacteria-domain-containing protein [Fomitopsis serialis]|uniref:peptidase of plants and bacteria-domain-containing protein n=1 Tax=Fomitopsis serialis TaxID=139415 RepID=UPI0020079ADC|nr:peptidase of plants and bacteria-domain-containing protein [Neoantrodia serialis]KAH9937386.1 peptidase of plants and bacteria-domain-containing protein [Neoantrodia serialis]